MPNGIPEQRDRVYRANRFWGMIWDLGDAAYYLGLFLSLLAPMAILYKNIRRFESWQGLLWGLGWAVLFLLVCAPAGFGFSLVLKAWARRRTRVERHR